MKPDRVSPRVLAELAEHGPMTMATLAIRTNLSVGAVGSAVRDRLERDGLVTRDHGEDSETVFRLRGDTRHPFGSVRTRSEIASQKWEARRTKVPPPPPPSERRVLPTFVRGRGDRDDTCARYEQCLMTWLRVDGGDAHCPTDCAHRTPRDHAAERDEYAASRPGATHTGGH